MKKKLLYLHPVIIILLALQSISFRVTFSDPLIDPVTEYLSEKEESPETGIYFSEGLLSKLIIMKDIRTSVTEDNGIPQDARLEKTEDKLNRIILSLQFSLVYYLFLIVLGFSSWFSLKTNLWFSVFLNRMFGFLSFFFILQNMAEKTMTVKHPAIGLILFLFYFSLLILTIYNAFTIHKRIDLKNLHFLKLKQKISSDGEEERETLKTGESEKGILSRSSTFLHFLIIIIAGILIGNIFYIPVFTIQKHFSSEFGFILILLVILLSSFYIKKYNDAGHDAELSGRENTTAGIVFLQYRFLKNSVKITLAIIGVVVFFSLLMSILAMNTGILRNIGAIEKSTEL